MLTWPRREQEPSDKISPSQGKVEVGTELWLAAKGGWAVGEGLLPGCWEDLQGPLGAVG